MPEDGRCAPAVGFRCGGRIAGTAGALPFFDDGFAFGEAGLSAAAREATASASGALTVDLRPLADL